MPLSIESIVRAGLDVLDSEGLESVTTRRLAKELGVQGPALYKHVRNKHELLGEMVAAMLSEGLADMEPQSEWRDWLRQFGQLFRAAMLRYRDGARMLAASSPSERTRMEIVPGIYTPLLQAGFTAGEAVQAEGLVASFVLGWVIHEQNERMKSLIAEASGVGTDQAFAEDLETVLEGLAARRMRRAAA
jgi:TetR/AcrR family tetracycline transcriptional repressor